MSPRYGWRRVFGSLRDKGAETVGSMLGVARQIATDEIAKDTLFDEEAETPAATSGAEADAHRIDMERLNLKLRRPLAQASTADRPRAGTRCRHWPTRPSSSPC